MADLLKKGYAEATPLNAGDNMMTEANWYLPHHPVLNIHKPESCE
jgi:hypothetical protein